MMNDEDREVSGELMRDENGRFVKGMSGNPAGRPKGTRNHIVQLRENTELALRDYLASPDKQKLALAALDRLFRIALSADDKEAMQAMKLLFDKVLPNAKGGADDGEKVAQKPIAIQIVNQTSEKATTPVTIIDTDAAE